MLRSDNITCVTVMLDPPGPPFSDCIIQKKKERLGYSMSSCKYFYHIFFFKNLSKNLF